jgi:hypothetical protein
MAVPPLLRLTVPYASSGRGRERLALCIFFITLVLIMKGICHICILSLVILLGYSTGYAQKMKFDVFFLGKKIGETCAEMKDSAGYKIYSVHNTSHVKFLFWEKKYDMSGHVIVGRDGLMTTATFQNIKDNGTSVTRTTWDKDKLVIDKNGEKKVISGAVKFPSILLYFFEPTHLQQFFYEPRGSFFEIKKEAEGIYSSQPSTHTDKYFYRNGKLIMVIMQNSMGSIFMKLVD